MPNPSLPPMEYKYLGRSGLQVSVISLGGWLTYGGHVGDDNALQCMKTAYDLGINFFDCAEQYSHGDSERVMGQAIKKFGWKRSDLVISTKLFWGEAFGRDPSVPLNNNGLSRKHIIEGLAGSLNRLQLDYVDLLYAHRPDPHTPIEETVRAFNYVINQGLALYWGTSCWSATEIRSAWECADRLGLVGPLMEQPPYNMLRRNDVEQQYLPLYPVFGLGLTVFSPLKNGILTGKYDHGIPSDSRVALSQDPSVKGLRDRFEGEEISAEVQIVRNLKTVADRLGVTRATLALAWVLNNEHVSSAIIGASRPEQVVESVKALEARKLLVGEVIEEIERILGNKPELSGGLKANV